MRKNAHASLAAPDGFHSIFASLTTCSINGGQCVPFPAYYGHACRWKKKKKKKNLARTLKECAKKDFQLILYIIPIMF